MYRPLRISAIGLVAAAALVPSLGTTAANPFKVTSTLDGKTVLPHRIHWLGKPSLPPAQIARVEFLIDGKVGWVEQHAPYVFSEDNGPHVGYLVTSFLQPGKHRFVVSAVTKDGRTATDTVVARVLPAPEPPAALAGTWERDIPDTSGAPKAGTAGNPTDTFTPPGVYKMVIEKRWILHIQPGKFNRPVSDKTGAGWHTESDYTAGPRTLRVYGGVTRFPFNGAIADGGGWWCYSDGPPADYTWSVNGDTLTLAPKGGHDACGIRGFIWTGEWNRVR